MSVYSPSLRDRADAEENRAEPLISVIVPIYQVRPWLEKCLDSIVRQSYPHLEIILVDDGSTDGCSAICDEWAEKDSRILVIHQENAGLSAARNIGLRHARGAYISFIDSDDYIHPDMIRCLVKTAEAEKAGIVVCHWEQIPPVRNKKRVSFPNHGDFTPEEYLTLLLKGHPTRVYVWNKLYSRELIPWLQFPEGHVYEDVQTIPRAVIHSRLICMIPDVLYYHIKRTDSITGTHTAAKIKDCLRSYQEAEALIRDELPNLLPLIQTKTLKIKLHLWRRLQAVPGRDAAALSEELRRDLRAHSREFRQFGPKYHLASRLAVCTPKLYQSLIWLRRRIYR